jgi:Domain of unknown function (DUF4349)
MTDTRKHQGLIVSVLSVVITIASGAFADDNEAAPQEGSDSTEVREPALAKPLVVEKTEGQRKTALVSTLVLKVINSVEARAALEDKATELGGFSTLITNSSLKLKVPPGQLPKILEFAAKQGVIIEKSLKRRDLTLDIAQLTGHLKSKGKILLRLRGFFDDSNVQATLRIEQTMTELVTEIELVKGRLRVLDEETKWALVEISFRFKQRDRIIYVHSPFEWLNTVNLDRFLEDF